MNVAGEEENDPEGEPTEEETKYRAKRPEMDTEALHNALRYISAE